MSAENDAALDCDDGATMLHEAAKFGHASLIPGLIAQGADVDAQAKGCVSPLHIALNREVANILLANGATVDARAYGVFTPVLYVSIDAHRLRHGTQNEAEPVTGLIETLVKHGADLDARGEDGNTLLHQLMHLRCMPGMTKGRPRCT